MQTAKIQLEKTNASAHTHTHQGVYVHWGRQFLRLQGGSIYT